MKKIPPIRHYRQVLRRMNGLANQYQSSKVEDLYGLFGCPELFIMASKIISFSNFRPKDWILFSIERNNSLSWSWIFKHRYLHGFNCYLNTNRNGTITWANFDDETENYDVMLERLNRHREFLKRCGYRFEPEL